MTALRRALAGRRAGAGPADRGAFALLYAVLVSVVVALVALAIDLSLPRVDRRVNRAAADAAALAGARTLVTASVATGTGVEFRPREACTLALVTALAQVDATGNPSGACAGWPLTADPDSPTAGCPDPPLTATITSLPRKFSVTWPVPDDSALLVPDLENNVAQTQSADPSGYTDPDGDGRPCDRVAVEILQEREFTFAPGAGLADRVTTRSASVGRALRRTGDLAPVVPLVVFEGQECPALRLVGQSTVDIRGSADGRLPGRIAVDSPCAVGGTAPINVDPAQAHAWAHSGSVFQATISSGRNDPGTSSACTDPPVAGPGAQICPAPGPIVPVTDKPWLDRYDCGRIGCDYVSQLVTLSRGLTATAPPAGCTAAGIDLTCAGTVVVPGDLVVAGNLTVAAGATVTVAGRFSVRANLLVQAGGCLALAAATSCDPSTGATESVAFVGGNVQLDRGARLVTQRRALIVDGAVRAERDAALRLVAPRGEGATCDPTSSGGETGNAACLADLALWVYSRSLVNTNDLQLLGGGLAVDGTVFFFDGNLRMSQGDDGLTAAQVSSLPEDPATGWAEGAQLVVRRLEITNGSLELVASRERSTPIARDTGVLIR